MSFFLTVVGIVCARDARETKWFKGRGNNGTDANNNAALTNGVPANSGQYYNGSGMYPASTTGNNYYSPQQSYVPQPVYNSNPAPFAPSVGNYNAAPVGSNLTPAVVYGEAVEASSSKPKRKWFGLGKKKNKVPSNEVQQAVPMY